MMRLVVGRRRRRQRLLALVQARLERFDADRDPATVLNPEAVAELTALLGTVPDPVADLQIAYAAGWLHWLRYLAQDPGDGQQDLADALTLFVPVYQMRPDAVPDQVRSHFGRLAATDDLRALVRRAVILLQETGRAGLTGDWGGLDAAIDAGQQAVAATPADYPDRAALLSNLDGALRVRFERTGDRADLDAAIDAGRQAVAATPADYPDRAGRDLAGRLSNLGAALQARFEQTGDRADLDAAVDVERQAVAASPADHPERAMYLSNLSDALHTRFERAWDRADLDAAIDAGRQAVAASPADHPERAMWALT